MIVCQGILDSASWLARDLPGCGQPDPFDLGTAWGCLRDSPAPITGILAKFAGLVPAARINVAELLDLPSGVPGLPAGRVVNSYLMLTPEGFANEDISAAAATLFVERSWLDANQVHEWSVRFSRFDDEKGDWRPVTATRQQSGLQEGVPGVFYSVAVPGFSLWAISGSTGVPLPQFRVEEFTITPGQVREGESVTISVRVRNASAEAADYNAALHLNDILSETKKVSLVPGQRARVSFTIQPRAGAYTVRIDQHIGDLNVQTAPATATPTPTATPIAPPTATPIAPPTATPRPPATRNTAAAAHGDSQATCDRNTAADGDTQATCDRNGAADAHGDTQAPCDRNVSAGHSDAVADRGAGNAGVSGGGTCSSYSYRRACGGSACARG